MRILHLDSGREMRGGQWQVLSPQQGLIDDGYDYVLQRGFLDSPQGLAIAWMAAPYTFLKYAKAMKALTNADTSSR